jgi:hypothetical protein
MSCDYFKYISLSFIYQVNNSKKIGNIHLEIQKGYLYDTTEDETNLNYEERLYKQINKLENTDKYLFNNNQWINDIYKILYEESILNYVKLNNDFNYVRTDQIKYENQDILENILNTNNDINNFIFLNNILYEFNLEKEKVLNDIKNKIKHNLIETNIKNDIKIISVKIITNCYAFNEKLIDPYLI